MQFKNTVATQLQQKDVKGYRIRNILNTNGFLYCKARRL